MALVELYRTTGRAPLPRARAARSWSGGATASSGRAGSGRLLAGPRAGRRRRPGRPRRPPALPRLRRRRRGRRDRRRELLDGRSPRWTDMVGYPHLPDRRPRRRVTATRRSGTRSSCRRIARTPRRARPSPASCSPGDSCWPPARAASRTSSSAPLYNGVLSGSRLDGAHFFYSNPLQRRTPRRRGRSRARHHTPRRVVPVRLLPAQPDAVPGDLSRPGRDDRCQRAPAPPVRDRHVEARSAGGHGRTWRSATGYPWDGGGRDHVSELRDRPGRCRSASRAGATTRPWRARARPVESKPGPAGRVTRPGGPVIGSPLGSTCRLGSPGRTRGSMRSWARSRSSAGRWSTPWRRRTSRGVDDRVKFDRACRSAAHFGRHSAGG